MTSAPAASFQSDSGERNYPEPRLAAAWWGLGVLCIAMMFAVVDRQILVLVTEPLKRSLSLHDTQIGLLNGLALTLVSAIATYPMGVLADRLDRRRLLASCVLIWSIATAACGFAQTFAGLIACAMGIAVGEAVIAPIAYSLIADLFPRRHWLTANYVFFIGGNVLGGALGLALGGAAVGFADVHRPLLPQMLLSFESWRLALMLVAIPGPLIALAVLSMKLRSGRTNARSEVSGVTTYLRAHARTLIGIFLGFGFASAAYATIATWALIGLMRNFGQTPAVVGSRMGFLMATASLAGVCASGWFVRRLRPRLGDLTLVRVAQAGLAITSATMLLFPFARSDVQVYAAFLITMLPLMAVLSLSPTILQNIAPGSMRARVIALGSLFYILCNAVTPVAVGVISDSAFGTHFGLYWSMLAVALPCGIVGVVFLGTATSTLIGTLAAAAMEA